MKRFDLESKMPNGLNHAHKSSAYDSLSTEFKDFIDTPRNLEGLGYSKKISKKYELYGMFFLTGLAKERNKFI